MIEGGWARLQQALNKSATYVHTIVLQSASAGCSDIETLPDEEKVLQFNWQLILVQTLTDGTESRVSIVIVVQTPILGRPQCRQVQLIKF